MSNIIFYGDIDEGCKHQVYELSKTGLYSNIRIMPDAHKGIGAVIGFTAYANIDKGICANTIGVDISCGVSAFDTELKELPVTLEELDTIVRNTIPLGFNKRKEIDEEFLAWDKFEFQQYLRDVNPVEMNSHFYDRIGDENNVLSQLGTLGGGNHFIEIAKSESTGNLWIVVHTGSRNLGKQVADYYQKLADRAHETVGSKIPKELRYLQGAYSATINEYIENCHKLNIWTKLNRIYIISEIFNKIAKFNDAKENSLNKGKLRLKTINLADHLYRNHTNYIESIHNYIDYDKKDNSRLIIRKGAIAAYKDQKVVIPMNMAYGTIIGIGKGNEDWNYSAPHGAGRLLSRTEGKANITIDDFKEVMGNVINTNMESCIDEAPQNYKDPESVINYLKDTVEVTDRLIPLLNIKG